jgi:hypothetical protein
MGKLMILKKEAFLSWKCFLKSIKSICFDLFILNLLCVILLFNNVENIFLYVIIFKVG